MRKDGNVEVNHLEQLIAYQALLSSQGGIWEWSLSEARETWHASLLATLKPFVAAFDDAPNLFGLLCAEDRNRLQGVLAETASSGQPFELNLKIEPKDSVPCCLRMQGGVDVTSPRRILAICHLTKIPETTPAPCAAQNSQEFVSIIEGAVDAIISKSIDGEIRTWNSGAEQLFGYRADEVIGRSISLLIPPHRIAEEADILAKISRGERVHNYQSIRVRKDGTQVHVSLTISPVKDATGAITGASKVVRNITDRVVAEAALRESEERLRLALASANQGLWDLNLESGDAVVSPEYATMLGYDPQDFRESRVSWEERLHPDDAQRSLAVFRNYIAGSDDFFQCEFRLKHADGSWIWILSSGKIIRRSEDGTPVRMIGTHTNISALKESEERFRLLFEAAPISIVLTDERGRYTAVNPAHELISGFTAAELVGKTPNELGIVTPANDTLVAAREILAATGRLDNVEFTGPTKTGEQVSILLSTRTIQIRGRRKYLTVSLDITNRKLIESAVRDNERMLRTFIENAPVSVAMLDRNLCYVAHSRRWLRDVHVDPHTVVIGRPHSEIFPANASRWQEIHQRSLRGSPEHCDIDELQRSDGTSDLIRWEIQPWLNPDGNVGGLVFFSELITDRVRAERALRESEERLAEAQRIAHVGDWSWNIGSDSIQWSDEVFRIFGHIPKSLSPFFNQDFIKAVHPDDRELVTASIKQALEIGTKFAVEHRIQRRDGQERILRLLGKAEAAGSKISSRVFGTVQDITDLKVAEQETIALRNQIAHAGRISTMGEMAAGIAHELNQPLAAINLYADGCQNALEAGSLSAAEQAAKLAEIASLANRCGEIIRRLRMFATNREMKRSIVNLAEVVRASIALLSHELRKSETRCLVQLCTEPLLVSADSIQLQQVFLNVIKNAMEAQEHLEPGSRRIEVTGSVHNHQILVAVRDFG